MMGKCRGRREKLTRHTVHRSVEHHSREKERATPGRSPQRTSGRDIPGSKTPVRGKGRVVTLARHCYFLHASETCCRGGRGHDDGCRWAARPKERLPISYPRYLGCVLGVCVAQAHIHYTYTHTIQHYKRRPGKMGLARITSYIHTYH